MIPHLSALHGTESQVHLQSCVRTMNRTSGEGYCLPTPALEQVVHRRDKTDPHTEYAKLHSAEGLFHMRPDEY